MIYSDNCLKEQNDAVRKNDVSNSRISPYTKSYLEEGTDIRPVNIAAVVQQPQPESAVNGNVSKSAPSASGIQPVVSAQQDVSADSPYVPLPAPGCDLPISPYTCVEQASSDNSGASAPGPQAAADVCPQNTVMGGGEGTKCDGYIPWPSTQPSL